MLTSLALLAACSHSPKLSETGDPVDTDTGAPQETDTPNTAPSAPGMAITPDDPTQLSDLTCTVTTAAQDPNGDAVTYTYAWFVHGVESTITDPVVPESATMLDDEWTCRVTPSDGTDQGPAAEASVTLTRGYTEVASGVYHACGIAPDNVGEPGEAVCWGTNSYGEATPPGGAFMHLEAGYYETCGADEAGALTCWGTASWGMNSPPTGQFGAFDLGWYGAYAVGADGALTAWGYASTPPEGAFTQVAGGENDHCALDADGRIACWGNNANGEGDAPAGEFVAIEGGYHNFCALDAAGLASCWGFRPDVNATPGEALTVLSAYDGNACGIRADGSLVCWGDDDAVVADVPAGAFAKVSVGWNAACALDAEGRATCWGSEATAP